MTDADDKQVHPSFNVKMLVHEGRLSPIFRGCLVVRSNCV